MKEDRTVQVPYATMLGIMKKLAASRYSETRAEEVNGVIDEIDEFLDWEDKNTKTDGW